jgi:bifunctional DNA-binding transcriptional regulator/antitoxin component of YhaV-PrlF toxin-antitoxin module
MALVEMDSRHRVTIPKKARRAFRIAKGQKFFLVPYGNDLMLKAVPKDPSARLDEIIGNLVLDKESSGKAEKWLLDQTRNRS